VITYLRAENRHLPEVETANADAMPAGIKALPVCQVTFDAPAIRTGKKGYFCDTGLEGSSRHAVVPNVKTADE
jgi:hypothetical protein